MAPPAEALPPLVVPLDGSALAERAVDVAVALARRGAPSIALVTTGWSGDPTADRSALDAVAGRVGEACGRVPEVRVVPDRPAAEVIVAEAELRGAAVCMATHGRSGVRRALLGSVAEDVVRDAPCPVLAAGPAMTRTSLDGPLVVCFDGSDVSTSILPDAVRWASALGVGVHVVSVDPSHGRAEVGVYGHRVSRPDGGAPPLAGALDAVAGRCRSKGVDTVVEHLQGADAAETVAGYAAGVDAALVALATHGRSGVRRTALGSVATGIVGRADCPVLLRRPRPAA